MDITAIIGSSRQQGNTEILTNIALEGVKNTTLFLRDYNIRPIEDRRHSREGFQPVVDDYEQVIMQVLKSDILIFSTPLYWYGMSGMMKNFIDRWSQSLRDPRFDFKQEMSRKEAYVIICAGDNPKLEALPLLQQFKLIFDFMGMNFKDYILGKANKPGEITLDESAIYKAQLWNKMFRQVQG